MSVSDKERSLRRRILYKALDDGTPIDVVQRAIDLLENEFGSEPEIRYSELIKKLCDSFDHPAFRSANLLGRIMIVRNKPPGEIGPDPLEQLSGSSPVAAPTATTDRQVMLSGRDLVFNTMLGHITSCVVKRSPKKEKAYRDHFLSEVLKMDLSRECGTELVSWAKSSSSSSSISGTDQELHRIINTAFVWMCSSFGPVDADKILLMAVNQTEQLPEAFEHSPRKFL